MTTKYAYRVKTTTGLRLRSGERRPSRAQVGEIQRRRMLAATVEAMQEVGYASLTVTQVIVRAGVSRKTFYEVFANRQECVLAAFEMAIETVGERVREAYEREDGWREGVRAGLWCLLEAMDEDPAVARLFVIEALGAGERVLRRRAELLAALAAAIDEGRTAPGSRTNPADVTAESVVGGVLSILHTRLLRDDGEPLLALLGQLMSFIVLPFLGARAAAHELSRPTPEREPSRPAPAPGKRAVVHKAPARDPLEGLSIRLTYRTVQVLSAAARLPGSSNRDLAAGAGIVDQGQISKLVARLEGLGLLENRGEGQAKGATNAWHLTPRGAHLERAAHPR